MGRFRYLCSTALLVGCTIHSGDPSPFLGEGGTGGTPTACVDGALLDGECDAAPPCCVKGPTKPFEGLSWFAIGTPETVGDCPNSTTEGLTGYAGMKKLAKHTCGACSCSPAACTLPEGIHTNAAPCPGDGSIGVPLGPDPAAGWTGACSEEGALPANLPCFGESCAQSVSIPTANVAACEPKSAPAEPFPDPVWGRMARECVIDPLSGQECGENQVCMPKLPGFVLCLYVKAAQRACPREYPVREVFHTDVKDERGCTLCECSDPQGAQCTVFFQMYSDATCSEPAGAVVVTEQDDSCVDVVPGTALASFKASMLVDVPGSCAQSGGEPFGDVQPAEPLTLCCQGDPKPPG